MDSAVVVALADSEGIPVNLDENSRVGVLSDPEDVARLYPGGAFRRNRKAKVGMGGMIFEKMADTERYFPQSSKADGE